MAPCLFVHPLHFTQFQATRLHHLSNRIMPNQFRVFLGAPKESGAAANFTHHLHSGIHASRKSKLEPEPFQTFFSSSQGRQGILETIFPGETNPPVPNGQSNTSLLLLHAASSFKELKRVAEGFFRDMNYAGETMTKCNKNHSPIPCDSVSASL